MEGFLHAVSSVTLILLLTATGYVCAAKGWMCGQDKNFISRLLMKIAIPCMCVYGLTDNLTRELLAQSGRFLLVPTIGSVALFALSFLLGRAMKLPRRKLGVFMMMCSMSNALFIGYAMCTELFGEVCTPYVMLYYLINTAFSQLVGISLVRWSGERGGFSMQMLVRFFRAPTVLSVLVGFALVLADVRLPSLVRSYCGYLSNIVTPLALVLTGYIIHEIGSKHLRLDREIAVVLAFRFLLAPTLALVSCAAFGIEGLARSVIAVESAMPVVTQTVVASAEYGADEQFAAQGAALSTLACFVVTPILMLLL